MANEYGQQTVQHAIRQANISNGAAWEGECGPIARALVSVFGGDYITVDDTDQLTVTTSIDTFRRDETRTNEVVRKLKRGLENTATG
jgi:hypothetical protein